MLAFHIDMNFTSLREDYLREWLTRLSGIGYTAILWELENKIQWETCPECVTEEAFSKQSFRRVLQYARSLGLENIPLLQTIGHAEYVLKNPKFHSWREDPDWSDCYCTSHPEVRAFLKAWIAEYLVLFDHDVKRFHLGGDEAYRFATCPECRAQADKIGITAHYADHLSDLALALRQRNIIPAIWGDMLLAKPEQIDAMPRHFEIWDWNYWDGIAPPEKTQVWGHGMLSKEEINPTIRRKFPELLSKEGEIRPFFSANFLHDRGWNVVLCSSTRAFGDSFFVGCHDVHAPNVVGVSQTARQKGMTGACVTSWGVRLHPWEVQYPCIRMAALAWHQPDLDFHQVESLSIQECLGTVSADLLVNLGKPFPFFRHRENGIQFNQLKDPVPAPDGYIHNMLAKWRQNLNRWKSIEQEIIEGRDQMATTVAQLNKHLKNGGPDPSISRAILQSATLQTFALEIGAEIIQSAARNHSTTHGSDSVKAARKTVMEWADYWMTPLHTELITNLVFCSIESYLKQRDTIESLQGAENVV